VEIDGFTHAGFNKVTGLKAVTAVIDYREGGENDTTRKLPGQTGFDPVTFERGMSNNLDFIGWRNEIYDVDSVDGQGEVEGFRKIIVVFLKDKSGARVKKWTIKNAWPSEQSVSDLDGSANEVVMESMVVQNEGIKEQMLV
jgi:phage tail-like protein